MSTSTDGRRPSVASGPGDAGGQRGTDDAEETDTGSLWLREEMARRMAARSSGTGGRHARRSNADRGATDRDRGAVERVPEPETPSDYVPRHSTTPAPPRTGPRAVTERNGGRGTGARGHGAAAWSGPSHPAPSAFVAPSGVVAPPAPPPGRALPVPPVPPLPASPRSTTPGSAPPLLPVAPPGVTPARHQRRGPVVDPPPLPSGPGAGRAPVAAPPSGPDFGGPSSPSGAPSFEPVPGRRPGRGLRRGAERAAPEHDEHGEDEVLWSASAPPPAEPAAPAREAVEPRPARGTRFARSDDPEAPAPGKRVRVVLAERKGVARPVRTVVDIQEGTGVGEVLRDGLIANQLSVALRFAVAAGLALGSLPLLFALIPEIGRIEVLGLRLPWLLLGVLVYPFLLGLGWWYTRSAERVEQSFADHVQD